MSRILLIDDQPNIAVNILLLYGAQQQFLDNITLAYDLEEATQKLTETWDLVIVDGHIPNKMKTTRRNELDSFLKPYHEARARNTPVRPIEETAEDAMVHSDAGYIFALQHQQHSPIFFTAERTFALGALLNNIPWYNKREEMATSDAVTRFFNKNMQDGFYFDLLREKTNIEIDWCNLPSMSTPAVRDYIATQMPKWQYGGPKQLVEQHINSLL